MQNNSRIPHHVSIIMDGNGRWAQERGLQRTAGHKQGAESVRSVLETAAEAGVKVLSLYAFSEENWGRPEQEVGFLMDLMSDTISAEMENLMEKGVRFRVLGNLARLHPSLRESISILEKKTEDNKVIDLVLFVSYSGKWDIAQAAARLAKDYALGLYPNLSENSSDDISILSKYLVTSDLPDPDLIIRTSGEKRLSNYLLWQGAYSEFVFTDTLWPDFGRDEFLNALDEFASRNRRYGKLK